MRKARRRPASKRETAAPIRIGVSACLLGEGVRYDGGHKRQRFIADELAKRVEFVPACPEVELGLGVPRESIGLVRSNGKIRLIGNESGKDLTRAMQAFAERRVAALARDNLSGYIFKRGSPSCGIAGVTILGARGVASRDGRGLFADALMRRFPDLPIEEEWRLAQPRVRREFIERALLYSRLRSFFGARWTLGGLAAFHAAQKPRIAAHSRAACRALDWLVAGASKLAPKEVRERYVAGMMRALRRPPNPRDARRHE